MLEGDGPLLALARRLRSLGPPSLSVLIAQLGEAQEYEEFRRLVREFLPEREGEILGRASPAAQVAAFADRHVVVAKDTGGLVTAASVRVVEGEERVHELVRMLSGLEGSVSGALHAEELLELAERDRR